jgi:CheY-like chemotaxis protein
MPEMNGFEFLDELLKNKTIKKEGLSIYILTSSLNNKDRETAKRYPILKGYLSKPLNVETMLNLKGQFTEPIG